MKKGIIVLFVLVVLASNVAFCEFVPKPEESKGTRVQSVNPDVEKSKLPAPVIENISKSMEFLKKGLYEEALKETAGDGPLARMFAKNVDSYNNIVNNLKKVPEMYGKFQDYSIIRVREIDKRVYRILILFYTDTLPLKFDLVYYKTNGKWVSLYFFFNDEIVALFDELYK